MFLTNIFKKKEEPEIEGQIEGQIEGEQKKDAEEGKSKNVDKKKKKEKNETDQTQLDIAFALDCTGSMGSYIETAKKNIKAISNEIEASGKDARYALVQYRDHGQGRFPKGWEYITKVTAFTDDIQSFSSELALAAAKGGGDGPEAVACALEECRNLKWREDAARIIIFIADAPPHGLGESGDKFPNGCACGHDPLEVVEKLKEAEIAIYSVAVEPLLGRTANGRSFFAAIAKKTCGKYLQLGKASLLPKVILGAANAEAELAELQEKFEKELEKVKVANKIEKVDEKNEAKLLDCVYSNMASDIGSMGYDDMDLDGQVEMEEDDDNGYLNFTSLSVANKNHRGIKPQANIGGYAKQAIVSSRKAVSRNHVSKFYKKAKRKHA